MQKNFFADALADNLSALPVRIEQLIVSLANERAVVACRNLPVERYAGMKLCELEVEASPRPGFVRYWGGEDYDQLYTDYEQVVWRVYWQHHVLSVVQLEWDGRCGKESRSWVVADSIEVAEAFILDVSRKTHHPGKAILVFAGGHWQRSEALYRAAQAASFDDLILADGLKSAIREDFTTFLKSKDRYERLGAAWRRGALLIGPPGNGKTHCVRALINELEVPSLYVQSLSNRMYTGDQMWQHVFDRARGLRPCVLVLEDLDSLVNDENRSFFLNQLDGFEQNHGLIVLATTNHPERIDPAIIDRPSRFDRKYHFDLPMKKERAAFLRIWQKQLEVETAWPVSGVEITAEDTEGFSFAYLKELMIGSVMKWMQDNRLPFASIVTQQVDELGRQMRTEQRNAQQAESIAEKEDTCHR